MAPAPEAYFASLDKCFSGDAQLLSWKRVFLALASSDENSDVDYITSFLSQPESLRLLSNCFIPFEPRSAKSKSEFESKTAAIHVDTSSQAAYRIDEIKSDALWLSQKAGIDEVAALRITVQEWQNRPNSRLLGRFSEEEATSLQDAASVDSFRVSLAGPQLKEVLKKVHGGSDTDFSSEKSRRIRLQNIYLSEKSHIVKTSRKLLCAFLHGKVPADASHLPLTHDARQFVRTDSLSRLGEQIFKDRSGDAESTRFLLDAIKAIEKRLSDFQTEGGWLSSSESNIDTENAWRTSLIDEVVHIMQIIYLHIQACDVVTSGEVVLAWLRLMAEYSFMEPIIPPCEDPMVLRLSLQVLASVTTLGLLKLPESLALVLMNGSLSQDEALSKSKPYFLSRTHITEINEVLLNAVDMGVLSASPAAFAWGTILYAMREIAQAAKETREMEQFHSAVDSFQSNQPSIPVARSLEQTFYEDLLDIARVPAFGDDYVGVLTVGAIEKGQVFEVISNIASSVGSVHAIDDLVTNLWIRDSLMGIIRVSSHVTDYSPELVTATLSILNASTNAPQANKGNYISQPSDPRFVFLHDDDLMSRIFHIARSRFPYESIPFLQLCRALTGKDQMNTSGPDRILNELDAMETFTQMVSPDFQGYQTIREDENANFVSLVQPIPMIASTTAIFNDPTGTETALVASSLQLQPATTGQVVSESKPAVIMWYHNYSGITLLGSWLEEWANHGGHMPDADDGPIVEIIGLLIDLIAACQLTDHELGPKRILEIASEGLNERCDIISVILHILERSLEGAGAQTKAPESLDITVACMRFVRVVLAIIPSRIWPFLSRSSLLGPGGKGSRFSAIVSATEVTSGNYPFLLSCVDLFEAVVEDSISNAAIRKITTRTASKSADPLDRNAGVPSHVISKVLSNFARSMIEVYNSSGNWRFNQPEHRLQVEATLAKNFERIIYYTYGIDETDSQQSKITAIFQETADYILDVLRPQSKEELPLNPVLRIILDGLRIPSSSVYLHHLQRFERQLIATLDLATRLVQAAQLSGSAVSLLEDQLFKASPILVKLYNSHDRLRLPVVTLLELLITKAALDAENEPASFLGHLGSESTCLFLDVLAQFDKPLRDMTLQVSIWRLLSAFVSKRQQWVAVYLLTGSSPRDSLKLKNSGEKTPRMRNTPFLKTALDSLANIDLLDPMVSLSLLEFVSCSQEHWPWATPQLGNHSSFFSSIVNYVSHLKIESEPVMSQINMIQIAAITANLCAIYLHSAKQAQDRTFVTMLVPLVFWYAQNAVDVAGYNASLHANLKRNFEMKYAGCQLQQLKRTKLEIRPLGKSYYYDLYLADKLLSFDFSWKGKKDQGFASEFERANLNLSLVEAQVTLFNSWKFFAIEHATEFSPDREIQKSMALIVQNCLLANTRPTPEEPIFSKLQKSRVDFALSMLQKLVEFDAKGSEVMGLLAAVWEAMRACGTTYENALIHDHTDYYRGLLNVLFLALQFHVGKSSSGAPGNDNTKTKPNLSPNLSIVLEVIKVVIAQGFRSLTTYLHDEPQRCSPKDFAIITAILQTALRVKDAERLYEHIVFHIEDNDTARYATTLFSWADQLTVEGDPVYGELSIIFLVELSAIPMLAEYLAVEAVLMKLSTSRLTRILSQTKAFGPFDPVPRLYAIWREGFLPLCLNLLFNVSRAAPEVAAFLNQFEGRLTRAAESFASTHASTISQNEKRISLSMASEANSLSLISFILERYRAAGPSAGVDSQAIQELKWDKSQLKEDIEELLSRRASLRARMVATTEKEAEWVRQRPIHAASGAENRLEEKIVDELRAALTCLSGNEET
ncbi:nucleoporin (Nup184), putative [Talaromyces stipitatus ATCC 10500]|uniref:Nucleoporin (Nup184), putative n=1 Tax=Talaromyces stipitatus (strain ATCC 10500 / CBS 375.48 / QM 6759 / NRRL 1006) TaxID=441959 RepID=B8M272_TALSN|nr:nucleoporin (Nup184), putative [Talaromyces stipitatus ATCC 10500]EED21536.1 nucleoporin (Nup184), putative [Talaromyces stipitatus ATCC 10500]